MIRHLTIFVLIGLAAVAVGAQGPAALQPQQRAELFKKHRKVIEALVEKTVESSRAPNDAVKRADTYHHVLYEFSQAIAEAKRSKDAARVADLSNNLKGLLEQGLAPTLKDAQTMVKGGTGEKEFLQARDLLLAQVDALLGILANEPTAKAALEQTRSRLEEKVGK